MNDKGRITKAHAQALVQLAGTDGVYKKMEIEEGRNGMLLDTVEEFLNQVWIADQKAVAYVTTAVPIPDDTAKRLLNELSRLIGKEIDLKTSVDESILGGVVVRIGDQVIDGSLKTRLQRIRDELLNGSLSSRNGGT